MRVKVKNVKIMLYLLHCKNSTFRKYFMKNEKQALSEIAKIIKLSKTFFIAGHEKPDGDSIGSALALKFELEKMGKNCGVYCVDDVPKYLDFLTGCGEIKKRAEKKAKFDCAIILESIDFKRMGDIIKPSQAKKIINIDHHSAFTNFGDVNFVLPYSSSTAELIFKLFQFMKIEMSRESAEMLYTGILTDTGRFQQLNTTALSHIAAAKFMKIGVDINKIYNKIYENSSLAALKLQGLALRGLKTEFGGQFAYMILTKDMFKKSGVKDESSEGIINYGLRISGVKLACLFKETDKGKTKASFRSIKDFNTLEIAKIFNGGGHKTASGCSLNMNVNSAVKEISKIVKEKFGVK
jgi:phosphoesterase RecJ-like protein